MLLALLETAGARDWTRASVARLAQMTAMCERYAHEALRELEDRQYIISGRRTGSTTFRTFVRLQGYVKCADEYIYIACEAGASSPACDEHSADELSDLDQPPAVVEPEATATLRHTHGRYLVSDGVRFGGWSATPAGAWEKWQRSPAAQLPSSTTFEPAEQPETVSSLLFDDSAEPEIAIYNAVELSPSAYTGITKHTQDTEARYALVWETMRRLPDADAGDQAEQLPLEPPSAPKARPQSDKPRAIDRYLVELAGMSESELAGELRKHKATLKKHSGAKWLAGVRDRLALVEHEIDARELHGVGDSRAPSQAPARRPAYAPLHQGAMQL
jgi:hypothetical protein